MFNLIITIISIALVAVLAIATIYYGGAAFNQGSARAAGAALVNHGQQVTGANTLFANDNSGTFAATAAALSPAYLSNVPTSEHISAAGYVVGGAADNTVRAVVTGQAVCDEVAKSIGIDAAGVAPVAADAAALTLLEDASQYGCAEQTDTADFKFWFKG